MKEFRHDIVVSERAKSLKYQYLGDRKRDFLHSTRKAFLYVVKHVLLQVPSGIHFEVQFDPNICTNCTNIDK